MSFKDYPMALAPGSVLNGRYIIEDVLGQGGFGITYKARDEAEHKYVAIKEYLPAALAYRAENNPFLTPFSKERQDDFEYGRKQFLNEAMRLGKFNYTPGIVHIHRFFEENGTAYFAMDLEDGRDFSTYLRQHGGKISWMEACSILLPVMRALEIVHSAGIIHRDIAPDNIFINKNGSVKLLDFGAARNNLGNKSASVDAIIKHGFSPKEQYSRRGNQDAFTDVYALAATFYYAITGVIPPESIERPDYADPSNPDSLDPPHKWAADLPPALENTILKAMSVRTEKRFQTMEEFREQVERAFRTGTTIPVEPEVPPADPPLPPGKNRIIGFLIALVIVLAAGAFYLFARNIADKDGEISGYVQEEGTGTPLHGVDVTAIDEKGRKYTSNDNTDTTNQNGFFELKLPPGTYTLLFEAAGYESYESTDTYTVKADRSSEISSAFKLELLSDEVPGNTGGELIREEFSDESFDDKEEPSESGESTDNREEPSGSGESTDSGEEPSGSGESTDNREEPSGSGESFDSGEKPSGTGESFDRKEDPSGSGESADSGEKPSGSGESFDSGEKPSGSGESTDNREEPSGSGESFDSGEKPSGTGESFDRKEDPSGSGESADSGEKPSGSGESFDSGEKPSGSGESADSGKEPSSAKEASDYKEPPSDKEPSSTEEASGYKEPSAEEESKEDPAADLFTINPGQTEDYSLNLVPGQYRTYYSETGGFYFSYPPNLYNHVESSFDNIPMPLGTNIETHTFTGSGGSSLTFSLFRREDNQNLSEAKDMALAVESAEITNSTRNVLIGEKEEEKEEKKKNTNYSLAVVTGYNFSGKIIYKLITITPSNVMEMRIECPPYIDKDDDEMNEDELMKRYVQECIYRYCGFAYEKPGPPRSYADFITSPDK